LVVKRNWLSGLLLKVKSEPPPASPKPPPFAVRPQKPQKAQEVEAVLHCLRPALRLRFAASCFDERTLKLDMGSHPLIIITGRIPKDARDFVRQRTFNRVERWWVNTGGHFNVHVMRLLYLRTNERIKNERCRTAESEGEPNSLRSAGTALRLSKSAKPACAGFSIFG
jgi:hypothetical protein